MARVGILYSHVATADAQLAAAGKHPTVDSVREALDRTGSKSTIAPPLKQWKAQHQGTGGGVRLSVQIQTPPIHATHLLLPWAHPTL